MLSIQLFTTLRCVALLEVNCLKNLTVRNQWELDPKSLKNLCLIVCSRGRISYSWDSSCVILAIWKFGISSKAFVLASSVVSGKRQIQEVITTFLK